MTSMLPPIRIVIADDHALFRQGLRSMFVNLHPEVTVVAEVESVAEVARRLSALTGRELRYQEGDAGPDELSSGWYEAIAAGELARVTDTVRQLTGNPPLRLEEYFKQFPRLLEKLSLTPPANTTES